MSELKTLVTCKPSEFLRQTNRIKKSAEKWLTDTDIFNIRKRLATLEMVPQNATEEERKAIFERNKKLTEEQAKTAFPASGYTIDLSSIGTDVAPAPSSTSDSPSSALERELSDGLPLPVFFAAGGALVVIVGVVIFLVIHNKNKKKKYN